MKMGKRQCAQMLLLECFFFWRNYAISELLSFIDSHSFASTVICKSLQFAAKTDMAKRETAIMGVRVEWRLLKLFVK